MEEKVAAIVSVIAGILTILLRIRELRKRLDPESLKEDGGGVVILDSGGKSVSGTKRITTPSMLIPAFGFVFIFNCMVIMGGFAATISVNLHVMREESLKAVKESLRISSGSDSLKNTPNQFKIDLKNEEIRNKIMSVLNATVGFIIIPGSFPLFVFLAYRRAFIFPDKCFNRAIVMGSWTGVFSIIVESIALMREGILFALKLFFYKYVLFFSFGLFTGILFLIFRRIQNSAAYKQLIK